MKNHFVPYLYSANTTLPVSLFGLVNRLQASLLPEAVGKKSLIINDVDKSLSLRTDEQMLAYVVGGMLSNAICSNSDSCIRIETTRTANGLQLYIRSNGAIVYTLPLVHAA